MHASPLRFVVSESLKIYTAVACVQFVSKRFNGCSIWGKFVGCSLHALFHFQTWGHRQLVYRQLYGILQCPDRHFWSKVARRLFCRGGGQDVIIIVLLNFTNQTFFLMGNLNLIIWIIRSWMPEFLRTGMFIMSWPMFCKFCYYIFHI